MSFFSSPATVPVKPPTDVLDPGVAAQREAAAADANAQQAKVAENAKRRYAGRTMGTEGANALFTSGPAGYGSRTMGSANV